VIVRKLVILVLFAVIVPTVSVVAGETAGGLRYSVTVTKFENEAGWHGKYDIGDAWGTVLTDMLNQTGKFIVLGETDMRFRTYRRGQESSGHRTNDARSAAGEGCDYPCAG